MRILITGIAGFGGGYLEEEYVHNGAIVEGITKDPTSNPSHHQVDILDKEALRVIISNAKADVIFHLAGVTSVRESIDDPDAAMRSNRTGTMNIYESIREASPSTAVVLISSSEVYGPGYDRPIRETDPTHPSNPYAKSKFAQEEVSHTFPDTKTIIVRPFNYVGPRQRDTFVIPGFCKQIVAIERGTQGNELLVGNLNAQRDFTDVRDFVHALRLLVESNTWGEIINTCSGQVRSIGDIVHELVQLSHAEIKISIDQKKFRPVDTPLLAGDHAKLSSLTGWKPTIALSDTLRDTLEYWRKQE